MRAARRDRRSRAIVALLTDNDFSTLPKGKSLNAITPKLARSSAAVVAGVIAFMLSMAAPPVQAQLASDDVPRQRTLPRSEEIRLQFEDSRYHLGPLSLQPVFGLRDLGYDNNVFGTSDGQVSDWRTTVSAGGRLILPIAPKVYLLAKLLPEYTWYQKTSSLRSFGGDYGASALGLFNQLTIEGGANVSRVIHPVSSELVQSARSRRTDLFGKAEVDIFHRLSVFGSAQSQRQRYQDPAAGTAQALDVRPLERNESAIRSGVRYRYSSFLDFSVAVERTTTKFLTQTDRDNTSGAVILGVHYERPRTFLNLSIGSRRGQSNSSSGAFPSYRATTGSYYASHQFATPALIDAYGRRGVTYGLFLDNPYFFETINGAGITVPVGQRFAVRGFGEIGTNHYPVAVLAAGTRVVRNDDMRAVGGGIAVRLYRTLVVAAVATSTKYDSNIPNFIRSVVRLTTTVSFRGDFF